jgi:hypothetical protein
MPDEGSEYKSIEEVRSNLYPRSANILDLEKEDVLDFPANLTDEVISPEKIRGGLERKVGARNLLQAGT